MAVTPRRTKGYVGRRLAFIIIWMFVTMFPVATPALRPVVNPTAVLFITALTLVIILLPPMIAARQIYRAFDPH